MAEDLELLETPAVDVDVDPAGDPKADEPFLHVNDRTVYKTREDATRGYNEAANRIQSLSKWEAQAKQWGLKDPSELDAVAQEILTLRKEKAEAAKVLAATGGVKPATDSADPKAKEAAQVREYLKGLGYISKEDQEEALKDLREQMAEMQSNGRQSIEQKFQNQEADAQETVNGWLVADGVKDDGTGTKMAVVGTLIKDWINNSDDRIERWSKGGTSAKALIKEGYDYTMSAIGWAKSATTGNASDPNSSEYAEAKRAAQTRNKGRLPAQGTGKTEEVKGNRPKQKSHINAELHEKAWAMFNNSK
jgi:hypothetical protein